MSLADDKKAQVSAELLLLISGILIIVLILMNIYQQYLEDLTENIKENEVNDLIDKIDLLNEYV